MGIPAIREVWLDPAAEKEAYCQGILARLGSHVRIRRFSSEEILAHTGETVESRKSGRSRILALTTHSGAWLKPCPGTTANYLCCGYQILHFSTNCTMNCRYCILQSYFPYSQITAFCNLDPMITELSRKLKRKSRPFLRVGTGEFTDSLCLDPLTHFSEIVVPLFTKANRAVLELKTKTANIENLLELDPKGKVIVSWSMNSRRIARKEELGAASLRQRLNAAAKCEKAGYKLGFHFDPIILHDGWEKEYKETVNRIFDAVKDPRRIAWISLGCFRFPPTLGEFMKEHYADCMLPYGEFLRGNDNKMRYFKPLRIRAYRKMKEWISSRAPSVPVYLCMESPSVWEAALGKSFRTDQPIAGMLSRSAGLV